jgi:alpha-ribazole phosphatase
MDLYLIRHGETEWTKAGLYQGWADVNLNDTGLKQASLIAGYLTNKHIECVISSTLSRARDTAAVISERLLCPLMFDERLKEVNVGKWEGKSWKEIAASYSDFLKDWFLDNVNKPMPGGESYAQLGQRVASVLEDIISRCRETVAVVTHGAVIKTMICQVMGIDLSKRLLFEIDPGSISLIRCDVKKLKCKVTSLNITTHLEAITR